MMDLRRGGLARPVAPEQRDDLPLPHFEIHPVQDVALIVPGVQILHLKHRRFPDRR